MATDKPMQLGMIGLGRMGANLVRRLLRDGHRCVVYDVNAEVVKELESEGASGAASLEDFALKLDQPRAAWLMLPAAIVDSTLDQLVPLFDAGDAIIDGGNSYYRDDITRAKKLQPKGIHYLDCGTGGGHTPRAMFAELSTETAPRSGSPTKPTFEELAMPRCRSYRAAVAGSRSSHAKVVEP
jgi:6-phosphogluconate dehydrogenase